MTGSRGSANGWAPAGSSAGAADTGGTLAGFDREAQLLAQLHPPDIAQI